MHVCYRSFVNSGCTVHCCGDNVLVNNKTPFLKGICIGNPDAIMMRSSHIALLLITQLSLTDNHIYVLPLMRYLCLICVGQLRDYGFSVNFDAKCVYLKIGILLLIENRGPTQKLYSIGFGTPTHLPQSTFLQYLNHVRPWRTMCTT